ncbi:hypothetical protein YPPY15_4179, partial [Yersinia pestis PY-15]|jgi:hypothetical protein
MYGP